MSRILVVDDEPHLTQIMGMWLERNGHEVVRAYDGRAALELLHESTFDILVTDITMPQMDGLALVSALEGTEQPRGVIVLTARADYEQLAAQCDQRRTRFLAKPFSPKQIVKLVEDLLAQEPASTPG